MMLLEELLAAPPKLHEDGQGLTSGWRLDDASLRFMDAHLHEDQCTVETGAGLSTILFAIKRTQHTCIVPDAAVVGRIRRYCARHGIPLNQVLFITERSEYALPRLRHCDYDFAVIDGRHGFPAPFIDWFCLADRLRDGGTVLVDDLHIWTCEILADFLKVDPRWRQVVELARSAVFMKRHDGSQSAEWTDQPFVYRQSRGAAHYVPGPTCAAVAPAQKD
jgi:hypothetical protein